jgi:hypothetical protein
MELSKATQLAWRRFLASQAGLEGMLYLREHIPSIIKSDPHSMVFDGGIIVGYNKCLDNMTDVIGAEPQRESVDIENR